MTLGERATGRDNNFNLVRLMAAGLVLVSHSWPLTGTPGEPLERVAGFSLGHLGVDIFFVVSGFLVTGSLLDRPMRSFLRARALRIFPALAANAFGTALVIGPFVTALPLAGYFTTWDTWRYALQNSLTWPMGVCWTLPGVFLGNPGGHAVNGALWSLPWELTMYVLLALLGATLLRGARPARRCPASARPRLARALGPTHRCSGWRSPGWPSRPRWGTDSTRRSRSRRASRSSRACAWSHSSSPPPRCSSCAIACRSARYS